MEEIIKKIILIFCMSKLKIVSEQCLSTAWTIRRRKNVSDLIIGILCQAKKVSQQM